MPGTKSYNYGSRGTWCINEWIPGHIYNTIVVTIMVLGLCATLQNCSYNCSSRDNPAHLASMIILVANNCGSRDNHWHMDKTLNIFGMRVEL